MTMTTAERQAAYRARRSTAGDNGERRISTWVSTRAALTLAQLALHQGTTQRAVLEKLLEQAYNRTTSRMDEAALDEFLTVTR